MIAIGNFHHFRDTTALKNPDRFRRSRLVGAHLGLTPRQSGEVGRADDLHQGRLRDIR